MLLKTWNSFTNPKFFLSSKNPQIPYRSDLLISCDDDNDKDDESKSIKTRKIKSLRRISDEG